MMSQLMSWPQVLDSWLVVWQLTETQDKMGKDFSDIVNIKCKYKV